LRLPQRRRQRHCFASLNRALLDDLGKRPFVLRAKHQARTGSLAVQQTLGALGIEPQSPRSAAAEVGHYGRRFAAYWDRRPGVTGVWQVSGRSCASYPRRLACDRLFAQRRSAGLYLRILVATVLAVLFARGAC
jgi:hypothetical protein